MLKNIVLEKYIFKSQFRSKLAVKANFTVFSIILKNVSLRYSLTCRMFTENIHVNTIFIEDLGFI